MRYYIADCHFYHKNLLERMDKRPFETVEEMNEYMIRQWNRRVHQKDEVIVLEDLSMGNGKETNEILSRLRGRICLIEGNHDQRYLEDAEFDHSRLEWVRQYAEINEHKRKLILMHYPIICYNGQYRRNRDGDPTAYMLHGHIHNTRDQERLDSFVLQTRNSVHYDEMTGEEYRVPCQMINCFCMYSDYTPLTSEEWIRLNEERLKENAEHSAGRGPDFIIES